MILPKDNMDATNGTTSDRVSQPPPSYTAESEEQKNINPINKTPLPPPTHVDTSDMIGTHSNYVTHLASPASSSSNARGASPAPLSPSSSYYVDRNVPAAFNRTPPTHFSYAPFDPMFLISQGKSLDKGFPPAAPPSGVRPHPFAYHDVSEQDWLSFLDAIRVAASLTEKDIQRSHLPIISMVPIVNILAGAGVQMIMKSRKGGKVAKLVDQYNHHFFGPRKLRVILMKGKDRASGFNEVSTDGQLATMPHSLTPSAPDDNVYRLFVMPIQS